MVAALLYYKKFVKSLMSKAFKLNPYDKCVANKIVKGKQITICFHVDDRKISHEVPQARRIPQGFLPGLHAAQQSIWATYVSRLSYRP